MVKVALPMAEISPDVERVKALVGRASSGDEDALAELTTVMDRVLSLWRDFGDVAALAQAALIQLACGQDLLAQRSYERTLDQLRAEVTQPGDGALERLLIERILTCWLQVGYADAIAAQNAAKVTWQGADFNLKRINMAHKRFLAAVKTLALVRKLARPTVQINVGENQVNVAGAPADLARKSA